MSETTPSRVMADNPLDDVLESFYKPQRARSRAQTAPASTKEKPKPTHYKIVCISLYNDDIAKLESLVAQLKKRGHTKANKSQLIRAALDQVNLDLIPKGY